MQIKVESQHGKGQMLDVQAIQTMLDDHIRQCKNFKASIEELSQQNKVLRDQNAENKVRIEKLEMELKGHNRTFSVSSQHVSRLT